MNIKLVYCLIQLLDGLGMGFMFPVYTPWLELHGLNFLKMGVVNFFYHISVSTLDPFTGFIADKFGKRRTFIVGQILWTTTQFIYGASSSIAGFLCAEGIAAVGNSLKSDALESWLQNKLGENESSRVMAKSRSLFTVGQIATGILSGYIAAEFGMNISWYASGTVFLVATILGGIALLMAGGDEHATENVHCGIEALNLKTIASITLANKKIVATGCLVALFSFVSKPVFMYWPQMVAALNMNIAERGWTILAISTPAMIGYAMVGRNMFFTKTKTGMFRILAVLCAGMLIAGFAYNLTMFFTGLILIEVAYGSITIVTYGYLYQDIHANHRSTVNSMISATKTLGGAASLLIMGKLADVFSPQVTLVIGGSLLLPILLYFYRAKE